VRIVYTPAAAVTGAFLIATGCAGHGTHSGEPTPAALAAVHADLRMMGGETTWVARAASYELVARTRGEIALLQPQIDGLAAAFKRVFPSDTLPAVVVTVRRVVPANKPYVTTAPLPNSVRGTVVDVVIPDPKVAEEEDKTSGEVPGFRSPVLPIARAWMSAHASSMTHKLAPENEADGEFEDPRVPAWAMTMIPTFASDSLLDPYTKLLIERPDNLIPIPTYFSMSQPVRRIAQTAAGSRGEGAGGARGGRGGMGGGTGGRGGRMGGSRGSRGAAAGNEGDSGLRGAALYQAESYVFGRYLVARGGYELIANLVDAELLGSTVANALALRKTVTIDKIDLDWFQWLIERGQQVRR
jgi:uncharacterized membrane protein YgcG